MSASLAPDIWRTPAAQVWRLVSGLPTGERERRLFMLLQPQAFVDDSVTPDGRGYFVLAGFVAPAAAWAAFTNEWQAVLDLEPRPEYFKMNEANLLIGQFAEDRGWTEQSRDNRLVDFTRVIRTHAAIRIYVSVLQSAFEHFISAIPLQYRSLASDNPYIYLFTNLIVRMATRAHLFGINEPCDFIFDEQSGQAEEIHANWDVLKIVAAREPRPASFLGDRPQFKNDKGFLPLQAADLYASQARLSLERNSGSLIVPPSLPLRQLLPIPEISHDVTVKDLAPLAAKVLTVQKEVAKINPNAPLVHFAATARERRLVRKRFRQKSKNPSSSRGRPS